MCRKLKHFLLFVLNAVRRTCVKVTNGNRITSYLRSYQIRKLHIGSGMNILKNWCNTDINPSIKQGIFLDARKRFPFDDCTFDYIFSEHLIEHLEYREGIRMFRECFRILKPGGKIRTATPDLRYLVELYNPEKTEIQKREIARIVDTYFSDIGIYQDVFVINNFFRNFGHKFIYDYKILHETMRKTGFINIILCNAGESSDKNLRSLESHGKYITDEINKLQTFVVEGMKPK